MKASFKLSILLLILVISFGLNAQELHIQSNAASIGNESNAITGWSAGNSNTSVTSNSNENYSGNYSIKIESTSSGWQLANYTFNTEIGEDYIINIYAKSASTEDPGFYLWQGFSNFSPQSISSTNWTQYTFNVTANATSATLKVYTGDPSVVGSAVYIDNISIVKVGGAGNWTLNNQDLYYNNGNVGIGTTSPSYKLDVNGNMISTGQMGIGVTSFDLADAQLYIESGSNKYGVMVKSVGLNNWSGLWVRSNNDIDMGLRNASGTQSVLLSSNAVSYLNGGNVGIGTKTPDEKLSVNGNIHTKEVRVDLTGWSDFVFNSDYDLPTLQEVEQHIKEKGHLQDIPSAEEVEEKGILLGNMNAKLLQKIEELTLYTIQQQKLIEKQSKALKIQLEMIEKLQEKLNQL